MLSYLLKLIKSNSTASTPTHLCRQGWAKMLRPTGKHGVGKLIYLSLEDYGKFSLFGWALDCNNGYAKGRFGGGWRSAPRYLHRFVGVNSGILASYEDVKIVDHIDGNTANNARWNIRSVTRLENSRNSKSKAHSVHPYKGVRGPRSRFGYAARLTVDGKQLSVSGVPTAEEAAKVWDALARFYHGEYARTNFPGTEAYDIHEARRRVKKTLKSGFSGVSQRGEYSYSANIQVNHKGIYLGMFPTAEAAAYAVDAARVAHGLPKKNFPD